MGIVVYSLLWAMQDVYHQPSDRSTADSTPLYPVITQNKVIMPEDTL